jgi:hypothetical protein
MKTLPPYLQEVQQNIYEFLDWVPAMTDEVTGEPYPVTSYRLRWNERTQSWECDWFDENGDPIDQGRRLSTNWPLRTPWGNGSSPDPMPLWSMFLEEGETGEECDYEGLGRTHSLVDFTREEIQEFIDDTPPTYPFSYVVTVP